MPPYLRDPDPISKERLTSYQQALKEFDDALKGIVDASKTLIESLNKKLEKN